MSKSQYVERNSVLICLTPLRNFKGFPGVRNKLTISRYADAEYDYRLWGVGSLQLFCFLTNVSVSATAGIDSTTHKSLSPLQTCSVVEKGFATLVSCTRRLLGVHANLICF